MDRDFAQCVGEVPWGGFVMGCIIIALGAGIFTIYIINQAQWYRNWQEKRRIQRKSDYGYWERKCKRERITEKVGLLVAILVGGGVVLIFGGWILYGFFMVVKCLFEN